MSTKVKRYGWRRHTDNHGCEQSFEFATEADRNAWKPPSGYLHYEWRKYTVTRTVRAKGRPLWWAIRQLQEGRAVRDADGDMHLPSDLEGTLGVLYDETSCASLPAWAQSWTLAVQP